MKIKNGVIRKPPPTPNSPERTPTEKLRKSSKKINNGNPLSDPILSKLNNEYKVINKFPLKDNQLTTYTYN